MKSWKALSSPVHATPMKSTDPAQRLRAASTEGASRLQMLQVGAQNQNTIGRPAKSAPSNSPPPTSGARKFSASGTPAATGLTVDTLPPSARGVASEQPATKPASVIAAIAVRYWNRVLTSRPPGTWVELPGRDEGRGLPRGEASWIQCGTAGHVGRCFSNFAFNVLIGSNQTTRSHEIPRTPDRDARDVGCRGRNE